MYPKLRFKGFDDAWEQRKLSDIGNIITGSTPSTKDKNNYNGDFLFVSPADIQGNRFVEKTITTLSELGFKKGRILAPKSTLFVSIGSTIGKVAQIRDFAVTNQQINSIEPFKDIDPDFVFSLMQKESPSIRCLSATQAVPILNKTTFSNVEVSIASNINEQYRIGELFIKLDSTITLHQRQCEALKKQKQFFLQNMFPKEGESVPRIRFNGFTEPWEQRKFDDVFNYLAHNSLSRDDLNDNEGSIKNIHYGDVLIKFGNVIDTKHEYIPYVNDNVKLENKACFLQDGDVVIADAAEDSTVGKCTEISESSDQKIVSGLHTIPCRPKNKFAKGFLGYYLNSNAYHDQLLPLMQGTKVSSISKTSLKETTIKFPSSIEEQKKVGACFHELDNLITLHQRQYEQLVSLKKYLLSKMFI